MHIKIKPIKSSKVLLQFTCERFMCSNNLFAITVYALMVYRPYIYFILGGCKYSILHDVYNKGGCDSERIGSTYKTGDYETYKL